jgi:uncharacterized protein
MDSKIKEALEKIETDHKVKILYACESGSRAWGFASKDSDYDVRFIYVHEKNWYFGIEDQRDVIELPINAVLDINGWDVRKALRLFRKSNAPLYEWLQSPVVYKEDKPFFQDLFELSPTFFQLRVGYHHYLNMTKNCFENELQGETVKVKKYFYALRPVLACQWLVDKQEMPPMEFAVLRQLIPEALQADVDRLLELKGQGDEKLFTARIHTIHEFIATTIKYCEEKGGSLQEKHNPTDQLDVLFRKLFD